VCRSKAKSTNAITVDSDNEFEVFTVGKKTRDRLYHKVVFGNGKERELIIDTGSPVSLMPLRDFRALGFQVNALRPTLTTVKGVSGHSLTIEGELDTTARASNGQTVPLKMIVTRDGPSILGLDGLRALQVPIVLATSSPAPSPSTPLPAEVSHLIVRCGQNKG